MTASPRAVPSRRPPRAALSHLRRRRVVGASLAALAARQAHAQAPWPTRPVRMILPFAPGFQGDALARALAPHLSAAFGQLFVLENRPGGGGTIGTAEVARATDGHTLGVVVGGPTTTARLLNPDLPYDPARDLRSVTQLVRSAFVFCVPADAGMTDMAGLLARARAAPGRLAYGSIGPGTVTHLAMEELKSRFGVELEHVSYRGFPQVVADLLGGRLVVAMLPNGVALPMLRDGRLRGLAVSNERRLPTTPDVPTLAEAGIPDAECFGWTGIIAPGSFPEVQAERVADAVRAALRAEPALRAPIEASGVEIVASTPGAFARLQAAEAARWGAVIRRLGLRVTD